MLQIIDGIDRRDGYGLLVLSGMEGKWLICWFYYSFQYKFAKNVSMEKYHFHFWLLKSLHHVCEISTKVLAAQTGVPETTWRYWRRSGDLPLLSLVNVCNSMRIPIGHFIYGGEKEPQIMLGAKNYVQKEGDFVAVRFLNREFGDEVTRKMTVRDVCKLVGMSPATFYRNFRSEKPVTKSLSFGQWLEACNKTKIYPMDFFVSEGVDVPVLKWFERRTEEGDSDMLAKRNAEMNATNARLLKMLQAEREKVSALKKEVAQLKKEVGLKRHEIVRLEGELDGQVMRAAESGGFG